MDVDPNPFDVYSDKVVHYEHNSPPYLDVGHPIAPSLPDSGARSEFSTGAVRDAMEGKGTPSLIPLDALRAVSRRFEAGAAKYTDRNWEKGIPCSRYIDSLMRHLWSLMEGDTDEDHGGALIWNAMCLYQTLHWIEEGKLPQDLNDLKNSRSYGG